VRGVGIGSAVGLSILCVLWLSGRSFGNGALSSAGLIAFRDAIYDEVHWAFYRAAPALLLNDAYAGVIIGAVFVLLELAVRPGVRIADNFTVNRPALVLRIACLLASGFLYLAIQNLVVMVVVHIVIMMAGSRLLRQRSGQTSA
jgi:hypothetical protein